MQSLTLTVVYEPVENGWVQARLVEIPGVITAGPTRDEAKILVVDALREYLRAAGESADGVDRDELTLEVNSA